MVPLSNGMTVQELWEEYHKYKRLYEKLANYINYIPDRCKLGTHTLEIRNDVSSEVL